MLSIVAESPITFQDYQLLDSGDFMKLERFGPVTLARPEPQAIWPRAWDQSRWQREANATFERDPKNSDKGQWLTHNWKLQGDSWWVNYEHQGISFKLKLWLSSFKHVGVFPEQAANWAYMTQQIRRMQSMGIAKPKVLNLFAYTGAASLAAAAAGAEVTHLDSVKQVVSIARESMEASGLDGIRWMVDDALKFVQREQRRGNHYHGIILDPPAYGRGPDGEKWVLQDQLTQLLQASKALLAPEAHCLILNLYSLGFSALVSQALGHSVFPGAKEVTAGELYLPDLSGRPLPLGTYLRVVG